MPDQAKEEPSEVLMVEKVPRNMDTAAAKAISDRGGYVHKEGDSFVAYTSIKRAIDFFENLFRRATEQPPPK